MTARLDYLSDSDDLVIYSTPGGRVVEAFMDGTKELSLPFEIALKSRDQETGNAIMWMINEALSQHDLDLSGNTEKYRFIDLTLSKPHLEGKDEQGYYLWLLTIETKLETGDEK